jgi:hypothetical protein
VAPSAFVTLSKSLNDYISTQPKSWMVNTL